MSKYKPYRFFLYLLLELGRRLILILPRRLCYAIAHGVGSFCYLVLAKDRKRMFRHLTKAFGSEKTPAEIEKIASRVFVNLAKSAVDVFQFPKLKRRGLDKLVFDEDGTEKLDAAFRHGKGVIGLTAHIGNWELLAAYFRLKGYEGKALGRRIYYEPFNRVLVSLRESVGIPTIYRTGAVREILRELRQNHWVGMLADQDFKSLEGIFVPFFGTDALTVTAPAKIALATGAAILPIFVIHEQDRYRLFAEDAILPDSVSSEEDKVRALTLAWSKSVESCIHRYPDQWVWMHDRWKTRPEQVQQKIRGPKEVYS
jgi:KDO2-lipid IV(A) lauroyltransferase